MDTKQLLRNYAFLLQKEIKRTSKDKVGDIEFCNDELKRIGQALKSKVA